MNGVGRLQGDDGVGIGREGHGCVFGWRVKARLTGFIILKWEVGLVLVGPGSDGLGVFDLDWRE